jgi:hypothetical protein
VLPALFLGACVPSGRPSGGPGSVDGATADASGGSADAGPQADAGPGAEAGSDAGPPRDATPLDAPGADVLPAADATPAGDALVPADGAVDCRTPGLLFCEDFEAQPVGPANSPAWSNHTSSPNSTLRIEDATAHARGNRSLHVHTDQNNFAYIQVDNFSAPSNSSFGRAWVWVDAFPTAPAYAHWTMVETGGTPANLGVLRPIGGQYDPQGQAADWGIGSDGGPTGDWCDWHPQAPCRARQWLCLEWELRDSDHSLRMWIDGVAHPELTTGPSRHANLTFPTFNRVWFGWWLYQANPAPDQYDLWFDDIVLSTTRVGCD